MIIQGKGEREEEATDFFVLGRRRNNNVMPPLADPPLGSEKRNERTHFSGFPKKCQDASRRHIY